MIRLLLSGQVGGRICGACDALFSGAEEVRMEIAVRITARQLCCTKSKVSTCGDVVDWMVVDTDQVSLASPKF